MYIFVIDSLFLFQNFFDRMAYNPTSSTYQTINSAGSRGSIQQSQQHIYEEQPYYVNDRPTTRQSIGGDSRRSGRVC